MSAKQSPKKPKPGRPATGSTKVKPSITLNKAVVKMAKKQALADDMSFSAWVESAMRESLEKSEATK